MATEKAVRAAAAEIQEKLGLEPPLPFAPEVKFAKVLKELTDTCNDGSIAPTDKFSPATTAVINELKGGEEEAEAEEEAPVVKKVVKKAAAPIEEEEEEEPKPVKKVVKKAAAPVEEEEEAPVEEEEESLEDQINACQKVVELTPIVKANAIFKPLVKRLPEFTKGSVLKAAMLELLAPAEEEEEEEAPKPVKKGAAAAGAKDKKSPFTSSKETIGTSRMIECAKSMQKIKGSQTIEVIATAADGNFVKAGGSSNIKQSKNIIKVLLPAAIEWGIVTSKGDKLSNA